LLYTTFSHYNDIRPGEIGRRQNGVIISNCQGKAVAYALYMKRKSPLQVNLHNQKYLCLNDVHWCCY
ncbi:MAG: hypothetical protein ACTS8W_05225, partial [Arsenophonus sp. NC-PY1-MAG3]